MVLAPKAKEGPSRRWQSEEGNPADLLKKHRLPTDRHRRADNIQEYLSLAAYNRLRWCRTHICHKRSTLQKKLEAAFPLWLMSRVSTLIHCMNIVAIIPARMGSSRFPGKPLALIHSIPMVGHVAFRTAMSDMLTDTYVATCDTIIQNYCTNAGLKCVMTSDTHVRCSTRTAEALLSIEKTSGKHIDIVVMVQGDEPMLHPDMIRQAVQPMIDDPSINVVNLMAEMETIEEFEDPNEVKVVVDRNFDALYFSREPIPSRKKGATKVPMRKQVCIIPFRRDYLLRFNSMEESPLEIYESVDMMRILEYGEKVRMVPTHVRTWSVDTPEDLARVTEKMTNDPLIPLYREKAIGSPLA